MKPYDRSQWPRGLRRRSAAASLLRSWVRIPPGAWTFVCCECCVLSGRDLWDELITRPEESYRLCCVVVCDLETSRIGAPYIYNISSLRVNDLTLILLTWSKWWTPNNATKWQMGFNSAFKGLIFQTWWNNLNIWKQIIRMFVYTLPVGAIFFMYKAFSVLYVITIYSQRLISNFILSYIINLALNLRVHPLASLCFCYSNVYMFLLCTYTSTVSALTLILTLALCLLFINTLALPPLLHWHLH